MTAIRGLLGGIAFAAIVRLPVALSLVLTGAAWQGLGLAAWACSRSAGSTTCCARR